MQTSGTGIANPAAIAESSSSLPQQAPLWATTPISGRSVGLVKAAWVVVALFSLLLAIAAISANHQTLIAPVANSIAPVWLSGWTEQQALNAFAELDLSIDVYNYYRLSLEIFSTVIFFIVSSLIFWRKSSDRLAVSISVFLLVFSANWLVDPGRMPLDLQPYFRAFYFIVWSGVPLFFAIFPNGRIIPRWMLTVMMARAAFVTWWYFVPQLDVVLGGPMFLVATGLSIIAQVYRYRHVSHAVERHQTKWVVFGLASIYVVTALLVTTSVLFPVVKARTGTGLLYALGSTTLIALTFTLIPISIGVAVLRYKLWNIDIILARTIVYGALTASVAGLYVLIVGELTFLLQSGPNLGLSLLATGVVAVLFQPIRERVQRAANRLVYGERDDPYTVIVRLGQNLEGTKPGGAGLEAIINTVVRALKLPYAELQLKQNEGYMTLALYGTPGEYLLSLPLLYQGEEIGKLLLGTRAGETHFAQADYRLLQALARQAGVAAYAFRLNADLQRSRERLVTTREEERRRLRRDLHDGLGPMLAAQTLKIGSARALLTQKPLAADKLLGELEEDIAAALDDIRRLVYNLRPPSLDQLGLQGAMREAVSRYNSASTRTECLRVELEPVERLPVLLAAVEVALFRIAQEALANVARHSQASLCKVRLVLAKPGGELEPPTSITLTITDNGKGIPPGYKPGVGLTSMRERAQELGGTFDIESAPGKGTMLRATLPLGATLQEPDTIVE